MLRLVHSYDDLMFAILVFRGCYFWLFENDLMWRLSGTVLRAVDGFGSLDAGKNQAAR